VIHLVGAGPGDPGLLTVRGLELLAHADVVVYDSLVSDPIVALAPPEAERIHVGKRARVGSTREGWRTETVRGEGAMTQDRINALLAELGSNRRNATIVRLKGGDPFLFGRGGEEAAHLASAGIAFEIVPGVSSALAAPAYAGIPVTHRGLSRSLTIVTGTRDAEETLTDREFESLARLEGTIVFLMGMSRLSEIASGLVGHGLSPDTPAAVVQWGSRPEQRTVTGTISTIASKVDAAGAGAPAAVVVGRVVELRETLSWFEARPLFGRRVVVTASSGAASRLARLLAGKGAEVVESPAVEIRSLPVDALDAALCALAPAPDKITSGSPRPIAGYTDLVITSSAAARILGERMTALGLDARAFAEMRVAAIGPATARSLAEATGLRADIVPESSDAEGLVAALGDPSRRRFLQPRAKGARDVLERTLGAALDVIPVYETRPRIDPAFRALFEEEAVDAVTFCSASAVASLAASLGVSGASDDDSVGDAPSVRDAVAARPLSLGRAVAVAIGPATAEALRAHGIEPVISDRASLEAVAETVERALVRNLSRRS
jgi:uroporphyrinogen III methyltransferase/synthase